MAHSSRDDLDRLERFVTAFEGLALDLAHHMQDRRESGPLARLEPEREPQPVPRPQVEPL